MKKASRFDPNEAIQTVHQTLSFRERNKCEVDPDGGLDGGVLLSQGDAETIHNQLYALRAYLEGRRCGTRCGSPLSREAVAALQQEAENAPDTPGIADWGRKAVLGLIASHEELRESIYSPYGVCEHCGVPMEREHALDRLVDQDVLTDVQAAVLKRLHHRRGCPHSQFCPPGDYPIPYWARPGFFHGIDVSSHPDSWFRGQVHHACGPYPSWWPQQVHSYYVPRASDGMLTVGPFEPGSTVEIKVRR